MKEKYPKIYYYQTYAYKIKYIIHDIKTNSFNSTYCFEIKDKSTSTLIKTNDIGHFKIYYDKNKNIVKIIPLLFKIDELIKYNISDDDKLTIKKGDTLKSIAKKYYKNENYYIHLCLYNNISDPIKIYPGMKISIPTQKIYLDSILFLNLPFIVNNYPFYKCLFNLEPLKREDYELKGYPRYLLFKKIGNGIEMNISDIDKDLKEEIIIQTHVSFDRETHGKIIFIDDFNNIKFPYAHGYNFNIKYLGDINYDNIDDYLLTYHHCDRFKAIDIYSYKDFFFPILGEFDGDEVSPYRLSSHGSPYDSITNYYKISNIDRDKDKEIIIHHKYRYYNETKIIKKTVIYDWNGERYINK